MKYGNQEELGRTGIAFYYKKKYQPIGLESSLKFESCRIRPLCVKLRSSSRNVGSPSRRSLWITTSVFKATYMSKRDVKKINHHNMKPEKEFWKKISHD
jgi:hypothetical protein